jgi:hypothetical protein
MIRRVPVQPLPHPGPEAPDIILEWGYFIEKWEIDTVVLKNIGKSCALGVKVGDFSLPDVKWCRQIEFQSIDANNKETARADFMRMEPVGRNTVEDMADLLILEDFIQVPVTFSDARGTKYKRVFTLSRRQTPAIGGQPVIAEAGPLLVVDQAAS